jgi:hypothetical protein
MLAKSTDYGLPIIDKKLLRVSNTPISNFFLQSELKAIKQGLNYTERESCNMEANTKGMSIKMVNMKELE